MNMQLPIMILTMYSAKYGLRNIKPIQLLERWKNSIKMRSGNVHFPNPNPTLAQEIAMCKLLERAILEAESGDHNKIERRNEVFAQAQEMFKLMVNDVTLTAKGNREIIRSAGLEERLGRGSSHIPGQVQKLRAVYSGIGKIKLLWKGMGKKVFYQIEYTTDPVNGVWQQAKHNTKDDSYVVDDLTPGVEYYFRVRAGNSLGAGDWSEVANFRCG